MDRLFQIGVVVLLASGMALAEQAAKGGPAALRPNGGVPKGGFNRGIPKGGIPKAPGKGPRLTNPASPTARLYRAAPDQRERVLEKLPAPQQERMRRELDWFDGLPKNEQDQVIKRSERLAALQPEKQRAFQQQMQALNRLLPERTRAVRQALMRLQSLPDERRHQVLASEPFRSRFSPEELQIITDLAEVMLPPR